MQLRLPIEDRRDARPLRLDVPACSPEMAEPTGPLPASRSTPPADGEDDRPPRRLDRHRPFRVARARAQAGGVTPVHFHVVDAPRREPAGIPELVPKACRQALACSCPGVGIDAEPQTERVNPFGEGRDAAGKLRRIGDEVTIAIALGRHPAVIYDHVAVTRIAHPALDDRFSGLEHQSLVDLDTTA